MDLAIPPLPPSWPFTPRGADREELRMVKTELPGLPGWWTLHTRGELPLEGEAEGLAGAFGRGGVLRLGEVVLRPYRRGGLVRFFTEDRYLDARRFADEFTVHRLLWAVGFPTVEPLGYGYRRRRLGVEGVYLTRRAEAVPWPRAWDRTPELLPELLRLLKVLADWGLHAPDLNATNVLLGEEGRVLLLDWDRARWRPGCALGARYAERLGRSLAKLGAPGEVQSAWKASREVLMLGPRS